jgi:hypothetical protein
MRVIAYNAGHETILPSLMHGVARPKRWEETRTRNLMVSFEKDRRKSRTAGPISEELKAYHYTSRSGLHIIFGIRTDHITLFLRSLMKNTKRGVLVAKAPKRI